MPRRLSFILASLSRRLRPWLVLKVRVRRRMVMRKCGDMLVMLWGILVISHDMLSAPHHP